MSDSNKKREGPSLNVNFKTKTSKWETNEKIQKLLKDDQPIFSSESSDDDIIKGPQSKDKNAGDEEFLLPPIFEKKDTPLKFSVKRKIRSVVFEDKVYLYVEDLERTCKIDGVLKMVALLKLPRGVVNGKDVVSLQTSHIILARKMNECEMCDKPFIDSIMKLPLDDQKNLVKEFVEKRTTKVRKDKKSTDLIRSFMNKKIAKLTEAVHKKNSKILVYEDYLSQLE